jgi:hypothetical protein
MYRHARNEIIFKVDAEISFPFGGLPATLPVKAAPVIQLFFFFFFSISRNPHPEYQLSSISRSRVLPRG